MDTSKKMEKAFYSTSGYWKGYSAASKLASAAGVKKEVAEEWLSKQALWQVYLPPPRYVPRPEWRVSKPNQIHQADLLFLPHDVVGKKTFKYALVVIDIASRYKDAVALMSKESGEIAKAFDKVYTRRPRRLVWPKRLMVDPGREFMGRVTQVMSKHGVVIQRSEAGHHRAQAFVERANRTLGEKIFSHQYADEMAHGGRSREWVKILPALMKAMNNEETRMTGKEPVDAIGEGSVGVSGVAYKRPVGLDEKRLPPFVLVRYLLAPGELEGGVSRRATDPIWSLDMFSLDRSVVSKDQPVLYYLIGGPKRGFVREELLVVPGDTELPPKS